MWRIALCITILSIFGPFVIGYMISNIACNEIDTYTGCSYNSTIGCDYISKNMRSFICHFGSMDGIASCWIMGVFEILGIYAVCIIILCKYVYWN